MSQVPPPSTPYPVPGAPVPPPAPPQEPRRSWFARHKVLTGVGGVVALLVVMAVATSGGDPADDADAATTPAPAAEAPAAEAPAAEAPAAEPAVEEPPAAAGIGTPVQDGTFEFTVTSVEPGVATVGNEYLSQDAQGQYVLVHLTIANTGTEAQYFDGTSQKAFDAAGREFSADTTAAVYLGDANSFLNQINPGNSVTGTVVFDVPADATLTRLELHDSMFSGGVEVALG